MTKSEIKMASQSYLNVFVKKAKEKAKRLQDPKAGKPHSGEKVKESRGK